jgi:hypothetical protein
MDDEWYYEHGDNRGGPCSGRQLRELADSGKIVPKDTIWKEGVEGGMLAGKVKNLFPKADAAYILAVSGPVPLAKAPFSTPPAGAAPLKGDSAPQVLSKASSLPLRDTLSSTDVAIREMAGNSLPGELAGLGNPDFTLMTGDIELKPIEETPAVPFQSHSQPKQAPGRARAMAGKGAVIVGQDGTNVQYKKKCTVCGYEDNCRSRMPIKNGVTKVGFFCPKCRKLRDVEIQGFPQ